MKHGTIALTQRARTAMIAPMARPPWQILVAEEYDDDALARLRAFGEVRILKTCDETSLEQAVPECHALLVRSSARVTRAVVERASRLRVIGRAGVGLDNIDVQAARDRGIALVHTPAAATDAVADLTIGLMIALLRDIAGLDAAVRAGNFHEARRAAMARELPELTLGVIGLGRIGRCVAWRCSCAFGMAVLYNDIVPVGPIDFAATSAEKEHVFAESDVISLHVPVTERTRHLINTQTLGGFKKNAVLINTARGAVLDHAALADALQSGRLAGAALDVFEPEPLPPDHPLWSAPNTLFTPHIGARTVSGQARMNLVVDDVIRVLEGTQPRHAASI